MGKTRYWIAVGAALAALAVGPARAADTFANNINWDFNNSRDRDKLQLNGSAQWVNEPLGENPTWRLRLTNDFGQAASAFITTPYNLSDYELSFTADVHAVQPGEGLADGFTFVAQAGDDKEIGGGGGALGYSLSDLFVPPSGDRGGGIPGYSYAVEFNSYAGQGLPGAAETIAMDILGLRTRFNQTPFHFSDQTGVEGALLPVVVRVQPQGVTVSGNLPSSGYAGYQAIYQTPAQMNGFFTPPQRLYLGFTAGTGGLRQTVDIFGMALSTNQAV